jgi:protein-arginine kinase activator protein McsA
MKTKTCYRCKKEHTTLYRVQIQKGKTWVFVCENCCIHYQQGEFYRYGGTWKGYRH